MAHGWIDRTKDRMKMTGISQEALANALGCTRGAVGHYLAGRRNPTLSQLEVIADTLNQDPRWLVFGDSSGQVRDSSANYQSTSQGSQELVICGTTTSGATHQLLGKLNMTAYVNNTYGLVVEGIDWAPRLYEGEVVVLSRVQEPMPGDEVLVNYHNGRRDLLSLVRHQGALVILDSLTDPRSRKITPLTEIESIHRILALLRGTAGYLSDSD
ncbi:MAG: helix-turn-helix transcriptional regulator [Sedimenticola sp.]